MPLITGLFSALALWLIGEFIAFSLVVQAIGLYGAIIATLATSLAGSLLLRQLGAAARKNLLGALTPRSQSGWFVPERLQAGLSAALGAGLLILPGFLSDSVGLLFVARAAQAWMTSGEKLRGKSEDVLDLSPQEWRQIDDGEHR